jgi:hypothetical protein
LSHFGVVDLAGIARAIVPALVAAIVAIGAVMLARGTIGSSHWIILRLFYETSIYCGIYLLVLRCAYRGSLAALVEVLPFRSLLETMLLLKATSTSR